MFDVLRILISIYPFLNEIFTGKYVSVKKYDFIRKIAFYLFLINLTITFIVCKSMYTIYNKYTVSEMELNKVLGNYEYLKAVCIKEDGKNKIIINGNGDVIGVDATTAEVNKKLNEKQVKDIDDRLQKIH